MYKTIFLSIFLGVASYTQAQITYTFNASNEAYANLVDPISLNNAKVWDDPQFEIPLGFDLQVGPHVFNTIYVAGLGGELNTNPEDIGTVPLLVPIGQDLVDLGESTGVSVSPISYKIEGAPGNQILKVEWKNVGFFEDSTASDFMNLQVWLYENTNVIEYRYGPNQINNPNESFEGLTGPIVGLLPSFNWDTGEIETETYLLSENPTNPTVIVFEPGTQNEELISLQGMIPSGTVYTFTPQNLSVDDFENNSFVIYPNPAKDFLEISTPLTNYKVNIYNNLGQLLMSYENPANAIDISKLNTGVYTIEIESISGKFTKKLIKK